MKNSRKPEMGALENVRDDFCVAVREIMREETLFCTTLKQMEIDYGLEPKKIGMLFGRWKYLRAPKKSVQKHLPEFEIEYKPGWDFNLIIRRKPPTPKE